MCVLSDLGGRDHQTDVPRQTMDARYQQRQSFDDLRRLFEDLRKPFEGDDCCAWFPPARNVAAYRVCNVMLKRNDLGTLLCAYRALLIDRCFQLFE